MPFVRTQGQPYAVLAYPLGSKTPFDLGLIPAFILLIGKSSKPCLCFLQRPVLAISVKRIFLCYALCALRRARYCFWCIGRDYLNFGLICLGSTE